MKQRIRLNTTIDKDLLKKIRIIAVEEEKRVNDILEEAIVLYFDKKDSKENK